MFRHRHDPDAHLEFDEDRAKYFHESFHRHHQIKRWVWAMALISTALLLVGFDFGVLPAEYRHIVFSWPSLLAALGVLHLLSFRHFLGGLILLALGSYFLAPLLGITLPGIGTVVLAPVLLYIGLAILFKRRGPHHWHDHQWHHHKRFYDKWQEIKDPRRQGILEMNAVFGGVQRRYKGLFQGGEINCVFGGAELDLSDAQLESGRTTLEINCVFGGMTLMIPESWTVEIQSSCVFGDFVEKVKSTAITDPNLVLILKGSCVFGGGEIKRA